jgi:hypothetical protein
VREEIVHRVCLGKHRCSASFEDYVKNGRMLISATLSISIKCTDLDSSGERVIEMMLNGQSITAHAEKGPWSECVNDCSSSRPVLIDFPIQNCGVSGKSIQLDIAISEEVQMYKCDGFLLNAQVSLTLVTSELSTHSLSGTWNQLKGEINIPGVPYMVGTWMHLTFVLRNPEQASAPRIPTVQVCALTSAAPAIKESSAQIITEEEGSRGILSSRTRGAFSFFQVQESTSMELAINRLSFVLRANLPRLLPDALYITISGLNGTLTPPSSDFSLLAEAGKLDSTFECVGGLKCKQKVSVKCPLQNCGELHSITFGVDIFCTDFDSADASKFIKYIRVCKAPEIDNDAFACDAVPFLEIPQTLYSRGPWQGCGGCSSSTRTVLEGYDMSRAISAFGLDLVIEVGASEGVSQLHCYDAFPAIRSVRASLKFQRVYSVQVRICFLARCMDVSECRRCKS